MTTKRIVPRDKYQGKGRLLSRGGEERASVRYQVQFFQEVLSAGVHGGPDDEVGGLMDGRGSLTATGKLDMNERGYTLELEDGRRIDVILDGSPLAATRTFITSGEFRDPEPTT